MNTLLYVKGQGVALNEPSLVRIQTGSGDVEAVGGEAEASHGREIGSAMGNARVLRMAVKGRSVAQGIPREATISGEEIREVLEQAPPELSADLIETGIALTGGSALLRGLDRYISADGGLRLRVADDPLSCVILGLAYQLNHLRAREWRRFGDGH